MKDTETFRIVHLKSTGASAESQCLVTHAKTCVEPAPLKTFKTTTTMNPVGDFAMYDKCTGIPPFKTKCGISGTVINTSAGGGHRTSSYPTICTFKHLKNGQTLVVEGGKKGCHIK